MSVLTKAFNCMKCNKPFDVKEGEPRIPAYNLPDCCSWCLTCYPSFTPIARGLMDFLNQPAFKKTDTGYEYTVPWNEPKCFGCDGNIVFTCGAIAFVDNCGHYLCEDCNRRKEMTGILCKKCNTTTDGPSWRPDSVLAFFSLMKGAQGQKLKQAEAKTEKDSDSRASKDCSGCGIRHPVERLYKCHDCETINCGNCSFDSHREHSVDKLLGIELVRLETQNGKRFTENVEGLHGNLKYIQTTIDEAVEKVLVAGKDRLTKIKACAKYDEAENIASRVDKAGDKFEQCCETYIPVARQLATQLSELGEELAKDEA